MSKQKKVGFILFLILALGLLIVFNSHEVTAAAKQSVTAAKVKKAPTGLNDPVLIAKMAVETACRVLSGEKDFPAVIYTPAVCISADNVNDYYDPEAVF